MKILHLGKYYPQENGGIEQVTQDLAIEQAKQNLDVHVLAFTRLKTIAETLAEVKVERCKIILEVASQPFSLLYIFKGLRLIGKCDIVHIHYPNFLAAFLALFIPRNTAVVVHWHSDVVGKKFLKFFVLWLQSLMLRRADAVVVTSEGYLSLSSDLRPHLQKVEVIPIGLRDCDHKYGVKKRTNQILFVGRLVDYKAVDIMVSALSEIEEDFVAYIVGDGPNRKKLEERLKVTGDKRILMKGRVSELELGTLFEESAIFCLPSNVRSEAFGVVLLEAMRSKCATVTAKIPGSGVPWVNEHGLQFQNNNYAELKQHFIRLLTEDGLAEAIGERGRERFLRHFTLRQSSNKFLELYNSIISDRE